MHLDQTNITSAITCTTSRYFLTFFYIFLRKKETSWSFRYGKPPSYNSLASGIELRMCYVEYKLRIHHNL